MIVRISYDYAIKCKAAALSDVCDDIVRYGHYISCESKTQEYLMKVVSENGSKTLRDAMRNSTEVFDFRTKLQQKYMRTVELDDVLISSGALGKPSVVILENAPYEWDVYHHMAESYKHDPSFGSLFSLLVRYMDNHCLAAYNGGGWCQHDKHVLLLENEMGYKNVGKLKLFCLMDSDSPKEGNIPSDKKKVCNFLCETTDCSLKELPIYTLRQDAYTWHMWYKRAIENYFPDKAYRAAGMDPADLPPLQAQRDYACIADCVRGYEKEKLKNSRKRCPEKIMNPD